MFDFNTSYENYDEQFVQNNAHRDRSAVLLAFPYKFPESTIDYTPMADNADIISHRMKAPLSSNEMAAVLDMVKRHAKRLGSDLWVATGMFLAKMDIEELGDLRRCDFVRAVNYLIGTELTIDVSAQAQSVM